MREGGFERKDFAELVKQYTLAKVLAVVAGDNETDGSNLMSQVEETTYNMLVGQAHRHSILNPVINYFFLLLT